MKSGALRDPENGWSGNDTRPAATRNFLAYSLRPLGTDHVDVYRPSPLDTAVPIAETIGGIAEQVEKEHVYHIGLSEVGPETIRRAAGSGRSPRPTGSPSHSWRSPGSPPRATTSCSSSGCAATLASRRRCRRSRPPFDPDDLAAIDDPVPAGAAAGDCHAPAQLAQLDSES